LGAVASAAQPAKLNAQHFNLAAANAALKELFRRERSPTGFEP